jgi:hypothetical protein
MNIPLSVSSKLPPLRPGNHALYVVNAVKPLTGVKGDYLNFFIADSGLRLIRAGSRVARVIAR